jgi:hypothetical protein
MNEELDRAMVALVQLPGSTLTQIIFDMYQVRLSFDTMALITCSAAIDVGSEDRAAVRLDFRTGVSQSGDGSAALVKMLGRTVTSVTRQGVAVRIQFGPSDFVDAVTAPDLLESVLASGPKIVA